MAPPIRPPQNTNPARLSSDPGEDDVAYRCGVVAAALELGARDDLPENEREQHRQAEAGDLERPDLIGGWMVNDGGEYRMHRRDVNVSAARKCAMRPAIRGAAEWRKR